MRDKDGVVQTRHINSENFDPVRMEIVDLNKEGYNDL